MLARRRAQKSAVSRRAPCPRSSSTLPQYGPSEPVTNQVLGSYQIQSLRKGLSGVLRARRVAITQCATYPAPRIFPLLPALARWTVPNVDAAILKDRPAIDCCEAVYFGHLKMTLCQYWIIRKKNRRVDVCESTEASVSVLNVAVWMANEQVS